MEPNYLQYAQLINQSGDRTGALSQLGQTLDQSTALQMQREQMAREASNDVRRNRLADLQLNAGNLNLAQDRAKSLATIGEYGTGDRPGFENQLAAAEGFKAEEAKMAAASQMEAEETKRYFQTVKMMKESGATPESITAFSKVALKQNPKYAGIADTVSYMDDTKMVITREVGENQLPDPTQPGKFLPAGKYELEGVATGNPASPYKFNKIVPAKADPTPKYIPEGAAVPDGKGGYTIPAPRKEKPIIINNGGRGGTGKPPVGYRFNPDGNLEAIPGGPADQKVTAAGKAQEGAIAAIDTALDSVRELLAHPGRTAATGASSITNRLAIPGGAAATFLHKLDTFKSQMFVPMVQQLKGMGQLSDAEGKKLTAAVGALEPSMSEPEFEASLKKIMTELEATRERSAKPISRADYTKPVAATPQNRPKGSKPAKVGRYTVEEVQ